MQRALLIALVGIIGLVLGVAVAGRPQNVLRDVTSSEIDVPSMSPSTSTISEVTITTAPATTSTNTTTSISTTSTSAATATTAARTPRRRVLRERAVQVVVANAARVAGLAARTTDQLRQFGYRDLVATDAIDDRFDSVIYYLDGRHDEAMRLALQVGLDPQRVHVRPGLTLTVEDDPSEIWLILGQDWPDE